MMPSAVDPVLSDNRILALKPISSSLVRPHSPSSQARNTWLVTAVVGALTVLPFLYSFVIDGRTPLELRPDQQLHVLLMVLGNGLVLLVSGSVKGSIDRKIGLVILSTLIVHAAIIFLVVGGRLYYSRTVLFGAVCVSILFGTGTVCLTHLLRRRRVGAIADGLTAEMMSWLGAGVQFVRDPSTDLRQYDVILVNFERQLPGQWAQAVSRANLSGAAVCHVVEYLERVRGRVSPDHFSIDQLGSSGMLGFYATLKRTMDILIVLALLPLVALVTGAAMLAIFVTMGRPVLFVQNRVGRGGEIFSMYKLRTMRPRMSEENARATALNDDRITPLGRLLRKYHIDELPQMWNVLKGDMSLVGPRPEQPELALDYAGQMAAYAYRHLVRPGITGWSQVCFGYAENYSETREKLTFDLHYIKYMSFVLDCSIAAMTVKTVCKGTLVR